MILYASNAMPKILIPCPHCCIVSRYDASFIEDAIKERKGIECVACFLSFNISIEPTAAQQSVQRTCFYCDENKEPAKETICQGCVDFLSDASR
jgi:hypothetical protein